MLEHNKQMQDFLKTNGIEAVPKWISKGSLKRTWRRKGMICYLCKKEENHMVRHLVERRNNREKTAYRDLCDNCYVKEMEKAGYIRSIGKSGICIWQKRSPRPWK